MDKKKSSMRMEDLKKEKIFYKDLTCLVSFDFKFEALFL